MEDATAICHRCGRLVPRGRGELYVVTIDAVADPETAPQPDAPLEDLQAEHDRLIEMMRHMSETELTEQVHRRLTIVLCNDCYRDWIENPAG